MIPSLPGYGFSGKPTETGWGPEHIAPAWDGADEAPRLHAIRRTGRRLGRRRRRARWRHAPVGLLGIHTNLPGATLPADVAKALATLRTRAGATL